MKKDRNLRRLIKNFFSILFIATLISCSRKEADNPGRFSLNGDWAIKSSTQLSEEGNVISTAGFHQGMWFPARVPTTVLNAFVQDGIYPDPRIGMNNFKIPDVSDSFNRKYDLTRYSILPGDLNPWKDPYWFRREFEMPAAYKGKRLTLHFDGINYRADVWLNGHQLAGKQDMVGMFLRFDYDISDFVKFNKANYLAVKIYQVDHPGVPGVQFTVFGNNRGHAEDIFKDETLKFSGGWDCAPVIRDRNMGIYRDVYITASGPVSIEDPFVVTILPLPDTSRADIKISMELNNKSNRKVNGILQARISLLDTLVFPTYRKVLRGSMQDILISKEVSLEAGKSMQVKLDPSEFPVLTINNPYLWWPNGYGKQYLHKLTLTFKTGSKISDSNDITFGIREVKNELKKTGNDYGRVFYINGRRVFCKGGWLQPDALLHESTKRIYDEARLLANANVNMVASEDAPSPPDEVLEAFDKYGLMCWETFYQCWRMYPGNKATENNPLDHKLAIRESQDIIKRYRNHPSLVLWCVANEVTVAEDIYTTVRKYVSDLDGTRPFIPTSSISWNVDKLTPYIKADLPLGTTDDGDPDYNWNPESYYFKKILEVDKQAFRNELGVPSVPVYSSLKKFIPQFPADLKNPLFPLDSIWAEHGAWDGNNYAFRGYDHAIRTRYGKPVSVNDYANKAQLVNANSYRAMFEAANHRMWDITNGIMLWKLNSCWPTVLWQLYDWFLCPGAAYYFAQNAMEPIHIQMNADNHMVTVINTRHENLDSLSVRAMILDINGKKVWSKKLSVTIGADRYVEIFKIPEKLHVGNVYFIKLRLIAPNGKLISENTYWQSPNIPPEYAALQNIKPVALKISSQAAITGEEYRVEIKLKNPSERISFFNRVEISKGKGGDEVLPTFWSTNYITLFPGEERTVTAVLAINDLKDDKGYIHIDGNTEMPPVLIQQ